jgi:hypothetical protein
MPITRRSSGWLLVALVVMLVEPASAQRSSFRTSSLSSTSHYTGQFTLARLWYPFYPGWSYDWPDMEDNLGALLPLLTTIPLDQKPTGHNIFRMDDPELLKFPVAYLSEPGYWHPTDAEVQGLRTYLDKGGFLIVDDFHYANEWAVFEAAMRRVWPTANIERLDLSHPIFHAFFEIASLDVPYPGYRDGLWGEFYGIHENNDPTKRLAVVINYNMDIGDYMEHSGQGMYLVDPTNEAFKFGINYIVYGLSH